MNFFPLYDLMRLWQMFLNLAKISTGSVRDMTQQASTNYQTFIIILLVIINFNIFLMKNIPVYHSVYIDNSHKHFKFNFLNGTQQN